MAGLAFNILASSFCILHSSSDSDLELYEQVSARGRGSGALCAPLRSGRALAAENGQKITGLSFSILASSFCILHSSSDSDLEL